MFLIIVLLFIPAIHDYTNTFLTRMDELAKIDPGKALEESLAMLRLLFTSMALLLCCFGVYLVNCGRQSILSQCFPPPHSWIIEEHRIITGHAAQRAGHLQVAVGYLLIAVALLMFVFTWWMLAELPGLEGM